MPEGSSNHIRSTVRCRPLTTNEKNSSVSRIIKINGNQLTLHNPTTGSVKEHNFTFDHCYSADAKTNQIYKEVAEPLLGKCLEGYNVGVLAYGAKSGGKSYTVHGTHEEPGMFLSLML